jgi:hypothetical protein
MTLLARRSRCCSAIVSESVAADEQMAGDSKCPKCGQTGWGKKRCDYCGHLACGKCYPHYECNVCRKGKMRDI